MKVDRSTEEYKLSLKNSLKWDAERDEPYLQLPSFPNLRITPTRSEDVDKLVAMFNIPSIGKRLFRLPHPMSREYAMTMVDELIQTQKPFIKDLNQHIDPTSNTPIPASDTHISGFPFSNLRNMTNESIAANITLRPHSFHFADTKTKTTAEEMLSWSVDRQIWDLGYVLDPEYGGRGIMSEMVGCVVEGWVRGWMGLGTVGAYVNKDNPASAAVMRNNGAVLMSTFVEDWPEEKGGGKVLVERFERRML